MEKRLFFAAGLLGIMTALMCAPFVHPATGAIAMAIIGAFSGIWMVVLHRVFGIAETSSFGLLAGILTYCLCIAGIFSAALLYYWRREGRLYPD